LFVRVGIELLGDPHGVYKMTKEQQLEILAYYDFIAQKRIEEKVKSTAQPANVSADVWSKWQAYQVE
jgi:hypothetical protein